MRVSRPLVVVLVGVAAVAAYYLNRASPAPGMTSTPPNHQPPADLRPPAAGQGPTALSNAPTMRQMKVVELNTASMAELESLPGMTEALARKIVAGRPYETMGDVEKKAGFTQEMIGRISPPAIIRTQGRGRQE